MLPPSSDAPTSPSSAPEGPRLQERYALHARIGEGASATVWEATCRETGARVALKRVRPGVMGDGSRVAERFVAEARALARLRHPHLVRIEAVLGEENGAPCLVMERLQGETLASKLEAQSTLAVEEAFTLLVPLMGALATAHDAGVLHRDVKPANLFLKQNPAEPWPVLLDFGAAKLDDGEGKATTSGMTVGTPCYMAPEQAQGLALGPHTDVWAMGVVFYRCLTGSLPFDAETSLGVVIKLSRERAPRLSTVLPDLPVPLAVALDRALEPTPTARYPDMRAFACALAHAAAQAGLDVPRDPEPLALPDYPRWLEQADAESTAALASVPPTAARDIGDETAASEATQPSRSPRRGGRRALLAAALAVLAVGVALTWARTHRTSTGPSASPSEETQEDEREVGLATPRGPEPMPSQRATEMEAPGPPTLREAVADANGTVGAAAAARGGPTSETAELEGLVPAQPAMPAAGKARRPRKRPRAAGRPARSRRRRARMPPPAARAEAAREDGSADMATPEASAADATSPPSTPGGPGPARRPRVIEDFNW